MMQIFFLRENNSQHSSILFSKIITNYFNQYQQLQRMNEAQSFSFLSFQSQKYPNNITFHEIEPLNSQFQLKESMIQNFPGNKTKMSGHLQVILVLQAAEIQRLTLSLHSYRMKFKQLNNIQKDYQSFQNQTDELLYMKEEYDLRQRKINQYVQNQNGSLTDLNNYLQKLESKYKRALKYIEENAYAKQQLQTAYLQLKDQLINTQKTFQSFKMQSIHEYQILREELENYKNPQLSFELKKLSSQKERMSQLLNKEQTIFNSERQKYQTLLKQEKDRFWVMKNQTQNLKNQLQKIKRENGQYRELIESVSTKYRKAESDKQNSISLLTMEIQRLTSLLRAKSSNLKQNQRIIEEVQKLQTNSQEEINLLRREIQRSKQKNSLYEEQLNKQNLQIGRLSSCVSSLSTRLNEVNIQLVEKNTEIKIKQNKLGHQLRTHTQLISKTQIQFKTMIEQEKQANIRLSIELSRAKQQLNNRQRQLKSKQMQFIKKIKEYEIERQKLRFQLLKLSEKDKQSLQRYRQELNKSSQQISNAQIRLRQQIQQKNILLEKIRNIQLEFNSFKSNKEERIRQNATKISDCQNRIYNLSEMNGNLQRMNQSLIIKIENIQKQKEKEKKDKSFEKLYQQIDELCRTVLEKQSRIQQLVSIINNLNGEVNNSKEIILSLQEMQSKMINLIKMYEQCRKQDQKLILLQMKTIFKGQNQQLMMLKETTFDISKNFNKEKQLINHSHNNQIIIKDNQIEELKVKIKKLQSQQNSHDYEEIISKLILVTKENSQLKSILTKKQIDFQALKKRFNSFQIQLQKKQDKYEYNLKQRQQNCKKLMLQLQTANNSLNQQKQNHITIHSKILELQSYQKYGQRQLRVREQLINDYKAQLKLKNEQYKRIEISIEQEVQKNSKLNEEMNQLKRIYNYQKYQRSEQFQLNKQQFQMLKKKNYEYQVQNQKFKKQFETFRQKYQNNQSILLSYTQKISILNSQFVRLQSIIQDLKRKNTDLSNSNYELTLMIKKNEVNEHKNNVLNEELTRLQAENINLVQQLQVYKLQISQQSNHYRHIQQNNALFVLTFAEIQSLRSRLVQKQHELDQMRRQRLHY